MHESGAQGRAPLHPCTPVTCTPHPCILHGLLQCLPLLPQDLMQRGQGQEEGDMAPQRLSVTICAHRFGAHYSQIMPD